MHTYCARAANSRGAPSQLLMRSPAASGGVGGLRQWVHTHGSSSVLALQPRSQPQLSEWLSV